MQRKKTTNKYQDGGKPKKRIILAETPTAIEKSVDLVPIDSKKYPLGTFSADTMREGRDKLWEEVMKFKEKNRITYGGYEDGDEVADTFFGATNSNKTLSELTKIVKDTYGLDISKEDGIIDAYKKSTGYPGVIKYGFDKYNLKETVTETKDDTFLQEAKKAARLSKENGVPAEVIPIYGKEQFEQFKAKYGKEALKGADIVILGHSSDKQMFGVPNKELNDFLRDNMDSTNICYGGTCTGPKVAASMPDVPNMYVNMGEPWIGVPDYKNYAGRDFNETFFGNTEVFNGQDEWATAKPIRAKYGVDYTNFRKDPVAILSENEEVVNTSRPQQNIQPLPTLQTNVTRMKQGGKTTKKCKDGCKTDMYQNGGAADILSQIMNTVNQGDPYKKVTLPFGIQNAGVDQINQQLGLAQNLAGLFELNNSERDELANRKDTLADYGTSISTFAPQGFAEEGGGVFTENNTPNLPSLQAILQGLPKEMKAKDKEKIAANANKELQQILGYKDRSPFKNLPSQTFDTDTLTMDGVSQPLLAIADNGQKQLMLPNSGEYYFPGASKVTEVPMAQDGGRPKVQKTVMSLQEVLAENKKIIGGLKKSTDTLKKPERYNIDALAAKEAIEYHIGDDVMSDKAKELYFKKKYKEALKYVKEGSKTDVEDTYNYFRDNHIAASTLASKFGVSRVNEEDEVGQRAYYTSGKREMSGIGGIEDVVAELTHAKQENDGVNMKLRTIKDWFSDPYLTNKGHSRQYNNEGSLEYEAHSVIEPELWDIVNKKLDVYEGNFKDGGMPEGKDGDIKKSWREGKKLAVYMGGTWHHFGDSSMQDFRQHKSEERKDAWYARHASALKGDDPRSKAFRKYAARTWSDGGQPKLNYQQGGQPRQMIFNLFKQKPMSKYADGGYSQSSPAYQYNLPTPVAVLVKDDGSYKVIFEK